MHEDLFERLASRNKLEEKILSICEGKTWEQIANALYQIIDDISTADDMCKENNQAFRNMVMKLQAKKNQLMCSPDGFRSEPVVDIAEDKKNSKFRGVSLSKKDFESKLNENMTEFARNELQLAGLFDEDSDYDGMIGEAVLELIETFAKQGHSGFSAGLTQTIFNKLASYKPLSELTDNPKEWMLVTEEEKLSPMEIKPLYQSRRSPTCFSHDNGKTYYDIDELEEGSERVMHQSKPWKANESTEGEGDCPRCKGSGKRYGKSGKIKGMTTSVPCVVCGGTGKMSDDELMKDLLGWFRNDKDYKREARKRGLLKKK